MLNRRKKISTILIIAIAIVFFGADAHAQYTLKQAQAQENLLNYPAAKILYAKAYKQKKTPEAARGLATIYTTLKDYTFAESWYAKLVALPHLPEDELHYAEVLMNNSKYSDAKQYLNSYLSQKDDKRASYLLAGCDSAQKWLQHPEKGRLFNMQELNSTNSDWGLAIRGNEYFFASDRPYEARRDPFFSNANIKKRAYSMTGESYLHLYESDGKDTNSAKLLSPKINGDYHVASPSFTSNGSEMYYAVTNLVKKSSGLLKKEQPYTINIELRKSIWDTVNREWNNPENFPFNSIYNYSIGDPWISPDGNTIYFTSNNGEDNLGGTDIFYSEKDVDGKWKKPVNMGASINTPGNERTPFFDTKGNFYFASDGRAGMGGLDIYKAVFMPKKGMWEAENMGSPINSAQDDFSPYSITSSIIYFSSNRLLGKGSDDIYYFDFATKTLFKIEGIIKDSKTTEPLKDVVITLLDKQNNTSVKTVTDKDGKYSFNLNEDPKNYQISVEKTGYNTETSIPVNDGKPGNSTLEGTVIDKKTGNPLKNEEVILTDKKTNEVLKTKTDNQGNYVFTPNKKLNDYQVTVPNPQGKIITGTDLIDKNITMIKTPVPEVGQPLIHVKLENIYFDLDKSNIRPDAAKELDKLVKLLNDNPTWDIEMSSHTDSRANDSYNLKLSQRRAESTVKYLIEHGINKDRLTAKGYGETRLVNKCSNGVPCTEAEHQENRRTEFTILDK